MVQISRQLSLRPTPHPNESILGYWARLAGENHIPFPALMRVFPPVAVQQEFDSTGSQSKLSTWAGQFIRLPAPINPRWVLANNVRWCPVCLAENEFWRPNWELAMVSICPIHNIRLYDRCPICNTLVYYSGLNFSQCMCGGRLTSKKCIVPVETSEIESTILSALYPSQFPYAGTQPGFNLRHLTVDQLHQFMLLVGCDGQVSRKPNYKSDINWSISAAHRITSMLTDWPEGYFSILHEQFQAHSQESRLLNQFGYFYRAVYKEFTDPEFSFLRDATERYLAERWPGALDRRHRHLSEESLARNNNLSQTEAAKQAHISAGTIRRWLRDGRIDGQVYTLPSGRTRGVIPQSEMRKIYALGRNVPLYQAAQLLKLPERRVEELIDHGILYGSVPRAGQRWLIPLEELNLLQEKVRALPLYDSEEPLTWDQIFRYHLPADVSFGKLFSAILNGLVQIGAKGSSASIDCFEDCMVDAKSFKAWLHSTAMGWTIPSLEAVLGIKQAVLYHLVRHGFISTTRHGRLGHHISDEELQRFRETYITGAQLAKYWNTSARSIAAKLALREIRPIVGPEVDGCRQNIFLRAQAFEAKLI